METPISINVSNYHFNEIAEFVYVLRGLGRRQRDWVHDTSWRRSVFHWRKSGNNG